MQDDEKKSGKKVLEERKRAFEAKYQQDEEIRFKTRIRLSKLAGRWAAGLLGLGGAEAEVYVKDMVELGFSDARGEKMKARLESDFKKAGTAIDRVRLDNDIIRLSLQAEEEIMNEILGDVE
jgi:hypothetical protein